MEEIMASETLPTLLAWINGVARRAFTAANTLPAASSDGGQVEGSTIGRSASTGRLHGKAKQLDGEGGCSKEETWR